MAEDKKDYTGLVNPPDEAKDTLAKHPSAQKDREYDLTKALLEAADFKNDDESITPIEIQRNGKYLFTFHITPISDSETRVARRNATTFMPNPNNRKLPKIEKDFNSAEFHSWLIYLATTDEDKDKIWNNPAIKEKFGLMRPVEAIDKLLRVGEKLAVVDTIMDISGMESDDEDISPEEYAKN